MDGWSCLPFTDTGDTQSVGEDAEGSLDMLRVLCV